MVITYMSEEDEAIRGEGQEHEIATADNFYCGIHEGYTCTPANQVERARVMSKFGLANADRADAIARATAAAFDEGAKCEACDGSGRVPGGRKLIHNMSGSFGADWDLESVIETIEKADRVAWLHHWNDHDLGVEIDGRVRLFAVPHPEKDKK